jgi:hypothetical protein
MYRYAFGSAFHFVARVNFFKYAVRTNSLLYHGRLRPAHSKITALGLVYVKIISARIRNDEMVGLGRKRY